MELNDLKTDAIKDSSRRKGEITSLVGAITKIDNMQYFYRTAEGKKRKNPNLKIKEDINILLKSGVVIIYSHWEGFVKHSSKKYLEFLDYKGFTRSQLDRCFVDEYINNYKKHNLSEILHNVIEDMPIPIDTNIINNKIMNLNYDRLHTLVQGIGFNKGTFIDMFKKRIETETGLIKGSNFIESWKRLQKANHFLIKYIHINTTKNEINGEITIKKILGCNDKKDIIGLVDLRNKIAHGVDINISFEEFISLSKVTLILIEVYLNFFKEELSRKSIRYL